MQIPFLKHRWRSFRRRTTRTDLANFVGPKANHQSPLTIATILDDFSFRCFEYEARLVPLKKENWRQLLRDSKPDFLFCESAWLGTQGSWKNAFSKFKTSEGNQLRELLHFCHSQRIPTLFWNKEDPPNYDVFIDAAKAFDLVATTAIECVEQYKRDCSHERVFCLPFAAQPKLHNPRGRMEDVERQICFAGAWRGDKYPKRAGAFKVLLPAAMEIGLDIYDRNFDSRNKSKPEFPPPFNQYVRGQLNYDQVLQAYRSYPVFLNVDSVDDSRSMMSRRVFELLACKTQVISWPALAIKELFGDKISCPETEADAREMLRAAMNVDEQAIRKHRLYREVHSKHSYQERMAAICSNLGIEFSSKGNDVVVVAEASNQGEFNHLLQTVARQSLAPSHLIILAPRKLQNSPSVESSFPPPTVFQLVEEKALPKILGTLTQKTVSIAFLAPNNYYGKHYLFDLMLTTNFAASPILGKASYFRRPAGARQVSLVNPSITFQESSTLHPATYFVSSELFRDVRIPPSIPAIKSFIYDLIDERSSFSSDHYHFVAECPQFSDIADVNELDSVQP